MIELSYWNINNGLAKGIHMSCWCPSMQVADDLFRKARDLWRHEIISTKAQNRTLEINYVHLRWRAWSSATDQNWKGFRGVHMVHPDLSTQFNKQKDFDLYNEMMFHNERHLDQWRA